MPVLILIAPALLIFVFVGLWVCRTPLAESLLQTRLSAMGFADPNFQITSVTPWQADIENFQTIGGTRLQHGEALIEWSTLISPRLAKITLTGLELEVGGSSTDPVWRELAQVVKGETVDETSRGAESRINIPEIQIHNAAARIVAADNSLLAEIVAPSASLLPGFDSTTSSVEGGSRQTFELTSDLSVESLRVQGLDVKNSSVSISGRIERRDGLLYYTPQDCDHVSTAGLKKEHLSVTGTLAACLFANGEDFAVAIDRKGRITLDLLVEPEPSQIDVSVSALPPISLAMQRESFPVQFFHESTGAPFKNFVVQELDLVLPGAGISLEDIAVSTMTQMGKIGSGTLSADFSVQKVGHLATPQLLLPVAIEGKAEWSSEKLAVDARFGQSKQALSGMLQLHRDNDSGEGEASFDIDPLSFGAGSLVVGDVSPAAAQYVARMAGEIQAAGKILFNDAWATPLQIEGSGRNLSVVIKPVLSAPAEDALAVDFEQATLNISLPPLSPEKGSATLNVTDGGLRPGDAELEGLTGTIKFLSLWPPKCPGETDVSTSEIDSQSAAGAMIVNCLYGSFAKGEPASTQAVFKDAMDDLTQYVTRMRMSQSPKQ